MGKLNFSSIVELLAWFSIVIIFFVFSYEFDQEIEIYIFGASGWPRAILLLLLLTTIGNFYHLYKNGSEVLGTRDINSGSVTYQIFFSPS